MKQSRLIGITGGIGSGKSLVSSYLISKGYTVVDFDKISRKVYLKGKKAYYDIIEVFGRELLDGSGEIDRKKLGNLVFGDKEKLSVLNDITHGAIISEAKMIVEGLDDDAIFLDIPLLFEAISYLKKYEIELDEVWLVYSDREAQISRIVKRDGISEADAIKRIDSQMKVEEKLKLADRVIFNTKDLAFVYRQVDELLGSF